jgi:SHS2 domain-containing protein
MFEVFEHTADLGLRIKATDLSGLFAEAGRALFSVIVANPEAIRPLEELAYQLEGTDPEYLFLDWLNELLFTFDSRRLLLGDFQVNVHARGLDAVARGEVADASRHQLEHEVKAITYHQLRVARTPEGWEAEVIVDI